MKTINKLKTKEVKNTKKVKGGNKSKDWILVFDEADAIFS
jgi:hypothetical protein